VRIVVLAAGFALWVSPALAQSSSLTQPLAPMFQAPLDEQAAEMRQRAAENRALMDEPEQFEQQQDGTYRGDEGSTIGRFDPVQGAMVGTNSDGEHVQCVAGVCR
jgi:hypothetical protein